MPADRTDGGAAHLLVESLQTFHHDSGDDFRVGCPTGGGVLLTLEEVAAELSRRPSRVFLRDGSGRRAVFGDGVKQQATRTSGITSCSTSTSTATPAAGSGPATRAGPRSRRNCCNPAPRTASNRHPRSPTAAARRSPGFDAEPTRPRWRCS